MNIIDMLKNFCLDAGMKVVFGLIVLLVGLRVTKWVLNLITKSKGFDKLDRGVRGFTLSLTRVVMYIMLFSSVAIIWGVPTTAFVTIFTSAGVAIGLAVQGALSNFAGGIMILVFKPFKVGDYIENGSVVGTVNEITVIYTILTTLDNKTITIPNGSLMNSNIINYSKKTERRVDMIINAGYNDDINLVEQTLLSVADGIDKVLKDPAPMARLSGHGADALEYHFRVWCKTADYWEVYYSCLEGVKKAFDKNGITIPYKQVDIHNK